MTTPRNSHSSRRSRRSNDFSRNKRKEKVEERCTVESSEDDSSLDDGENQEERDHKIVELSVKAGLFLFGGLSLCFSTLFIPGVVPFNTWLILTCKENNCCYMHKMTSISFKIVENIILSETNCYFVSCLYPIHVVTFTLISNLARLSSSLLNKICRQIWYQRKSGYMDRAYETFSVLFIMFFLNSLFQEIIIKDKLDWIHIGL